MSDDLVLGVSALTAGYGRAAVLHGVDLSVSRAESIAIVGANGAGKSTLVRALCGLTMPWSGTIRFGGADIARLPPHERVKRGLVAVLEGRRLFGELSVRHHLSLAARYGRRADAHALTLTDVLAMFPFMRARMDAPVQLLSGGEQQMVAIARALLLQPELLIMDEPSTGLAPKVVKDIVEVVAQLRRRGMSIVLVEQNAVLAAALTERGYVMSLGRMVHRVDAGEWASFLAGGQLAQTYLAG
jgi:ABC-type branched-subunit amino acid transport system ATPase component